MVNEALRAAPAASPRGGGRAKQLARGRSIASPPPSEPDMPKSKPLMAKSSGTDANTAVQSALRTLDAGVSGVNAIATALKGALAPDRRDTSAQRGTCARGIQARGTV